MVTASNNVSCNFFLKRIDILCSNKINNAHMITPLIYGYYNDSFAAWNLVLSQISQPEKG